MRRQDTAHRTRCKGQNHLRPHQQTGIVFLFVFVCPGVSAVTIFTVSEQSWSLLDSNSSTTSQLRMEHLTGTDERRE